MGDSSGSGPPTSSASGPPQLSFVTATSLDDFKNPQTMRQVRRAVMQTYLSRAENDPNSTDVRVKKKRQGSRNKKLTSPAQSPQLSQASSSSSALIDPLLQSGRKDSRVEEGPVPLFDSGEPLWSSNVPLASSRVQSGRSFSVVEDTFGTPLVGVTSGSSTSSVAPLETLESGDVFGHDVSLVRRRPLSESHVYDAAYQTPYGLNIREVAPDPFAASAPLTNSDINIEMLKANCTNYFSSRGLARDWAPYLLATPASFLSSLCISAAFSDVMAVSNQQSGQLDRDSRQTLELLDVVPRMINESLSDPSQGYSDSNIAAVLQFLCSQMSSDNPLIPPVHQKVLKHMVVQRGGLAKIGETGVIPIHLSITDLEANFLRNEAADPMYLVFARQHVDNNPNISLITPESPIYSQDADMRVIAASPNCTASTHQLVSHARRLTELYLKLCRSRIRQTTLPIIYVDRTKETAMETEIRDITQKIHNMPLANTRGHQGYNDAIYEVVRLASLLYAHAIFLSAPFHQVATLRCPMEHEGDCKATPQMIQRAIMKTDIASAWDGLAGVFYWVLLVAGAACHQVQRASQSEQDLRSAIDQSLYQTSGISPSLLGSFEGRARSESAPARQLKPSNLATQQQQQATAPPVSPEQPSRYFQQYVAEQHLDVARAANPAASISPSITSSSTSSPLPSSSLSVTSLPAPASSASTSASPTPAESLSSIRRGKRTRTSPLLVKAPLVTTGVSTLIGQPTNTSPPRSKEERAQAYIRSFLIANAVRCSILLRFEHTTAVASSIVTLSEIRAFLAGETLGN